MPSWDDTRDGEDFDQYWEQDRINERDEWDLMERDLEEREQERLDDHGQ